MRSSLIYLKSVVILACLFTSTKAVIKKKPQTVDAQQLSDVYSRLDKIERCLSQEPIGFTAILSLPSQISVNRGYNVPFNLVLENLGNAYNMTSSTFVAPTDGMYAFTVHLTDGDGEQLMYLVLNGSDKRVVYANTSGRYDSSTILSVMKLKSGDKVYVRAPETGVTIVGQNQSAFSGFLIQPDCGFNNGPIRSNISV